ncbi:hypothetical protein GCM10018952_12420 [Streptosporangium vulgare]
MLATLAARASPSRIKASPGLSDEASRAKVLPGRGTGRDGPGTGPGTDSETGLGTARRRLGEKNPSRLLRTKAGRNLLPLLGGKARSPVGGRSPLPVTPGTGGDPDGTMRWQVPAIPP